MEPGHEPIAGPHEGFSETALNASLLAGVRADEITASCPIGARMGDGAFHPNVEERHAAPEDEK
jgi:hypothetical protein